MSDLIKLNNIAKRNGNIKAFTLSTNLKSVKTCNNGWGEVLIAIDNNSVQDILKNDVLGVLYIVNKEDWELESAKPQENLETLGYSFETGI